MVGGPPSKMNGSGPKIRLKSPLAPQPVPQKLDSMPPSKGPFSANMHPIISANMHPIIPKLSVPIPEGMCFRKMVGGPLRKWTDRCQKSTSNHHKESRTHTFFESTCPELYEQQSWEWSDAYSWRNDSNHHKDSSRLLTNPLKVHFPEVISPRICIWSFPTLLFENPYLFSYSSGHVLSKKVWVLDSKMYGYR